MNTKQRWNRILSLVLILAMLLPSSAFAAPQESAQELAEIAVQDELAADGLQAEETQTARPATRAEAALSADARASVQSQLHSLGNTGDYEAATAAAATHDLPNVKMPEGFIAPDPSKGTLMQFVDGAPECSYTWVHNPTTTSPTQIGGGVLAGTVGDGVGSDLQIKTVSQSIGHTIAATDIVEIRIKPKSSSTTGLTVCQVYWSLPTALSAFSGTRCVTAAEKLDLSSPEYQVLTFKLGAKSDAVGTVIGGLRFDLDAAVQVEYEIDYIYIGAPENAPSVYQDYVFFDFAGGAADLARYKNSVYGGNGTNRDVKAAWYWSKCSVAITDKNLVLTPNATGTVYIRPTTGTSTAAASTNVMNYTCGSNDVFMIRMKATGSATSTMINLQYHNGTKWVNSVEKTCAFTADKYFTAKIDMSSVRSQIGGLQIEFQGITDGTITVDWIYMGPEEKAPVHDNLFFDFTSPSTILPRYTGKTYGDVNFDSKNAWKHRAYTMNADAVTSGNLTATLLETPSSEDGSNYFETVQLLSYVPTAGDYLQMRLKIDNGAAFGNYTELQIGAIFSRNDATNWSSFQAKNVPARVIDRGYFTVTVPLAAAVTDYVSIDTIRVRVDRLINAAGATATISIDYIYVGPEDMLPVQDFLYFDFENTQADKDRYATKTYGGVNYDSASWHSNHDYYTAPAINNEFGTLSFSNNEACPTDRHSHQVVTSTGHSFSDGHSLQYTPNGNDYFAVRMKIEGSPDTAINLRMMYAINGVKGTESYGNTYFTIPASAVNEGYFVISGLMSEEFRTANEVNAIRVEVYNLKGIGGSTVATFTIDYIYVGTQEDLPTTNGDAIFIDYRNDDAAKARYASDIYGGLNFDLVGNYNSFSTTNIEQVTTSGVGNLVMKNIDRGAAFAQTANGANGDRYPLHFRPEVDDVVQMRFKVSGASAVSAYVFYGFDDHTIVSNDTCFAQDTVDDAYIRQGQYFILNIELEDAVTHAAKLTSLRPHFTFTETTGVTVNLDYIYVGPQESAPYSYQAKRTLSSTDASGENYRIRYEIDFFKPTACGRIRVNELLQQEFELYDRDDKSFGPDAIKVYKKAYSNKGNYVDDLVAMPASGVYSKSVTGGTGEQKQITFYLNDGDNAYRRDNYGDTVAGYRYVLNINFRVDHDATMGGNGVLVNQLQKSWTKFQKRDADGTFSSTLTELFNYKEETLNVAFAKPVGHDFFMELHDTDSAAEDFTTAANAIDNKFEDDDNMFSLDTYATYRDNMLSAGRKLDLIEYLNYEKADGNADRGENMIFANMLTNIGDGITNKYTRVNYWVMFNDGDKVVDLAYDQKARLYREIVPWEADKVESIDRRPVGLSRDELPYFDPTEDQVLTVRAFYVPKVTEGVDSLGREYYKDYLQDIRTNKETYVTYFAPKFAVVDYGRTVSVNMRMEGQQIGTWDIAQDETAGVQYDYGFHILSTNGQLDEHLANIKYNFRKSFMDDSSRFLLEDTADIYYLTRSRNGEKGTEKRTIASFEPEVKALHEGTGVAYDMNLDQYYDKEQNSITYTFGDATETPKALEGLYYTTLRKVTIIPANNIYYDMDKFYRESRWASDGKREGDLQAHDYEDEYASPYGYDPNWYANASDGEPNNHSWGRAWKTTVSTASNNPRANFTFYGTGFEIHSHTLSTTGVIIVEVYSGSKYSAIGDDTNLVRRFLVDTYHADGDLYQIPIVVCNDLPYGQYTVRARAYYHNIFDHHYTIETTSTQQQKRSAPMAVTEENIRSVLGLSEDSPLTFIPSESGYPKITRGVTVKYQGYYDAYLDGFRIYNPMDDVITEEEYPLEYYAYKLSDEINTAGTETRTEFYNLKNDLLLDRSTWAGNEANGVLYLGDGTTQVEQGDQVGSNEDGEYALRLGMEGELETKADHLFFDFTDTPYDANRYDNSVYGGMNYDVEGWHYNHQHDTPITYDAENGTISFSKIANEAARSIHTIITSSNSSYSGGHPLSYIPGKNDCFEVKMKIEGSPDTTADFRLKFAKDSDNSSEHIAYTCAIPSEYINSGSFFTLSGDLDDIFTTAGCITAIRPEVGNLIMPANSTGLTITIDYIYIGPDRTQDYLLFDFTDGPDDRQRYNNIVYGGMNFDKTENWNTNGSLKPITFDTSDNGTAKLEVVDNYDSSKYTGWHEINIGANASYRGLRYEPGADDICEIRLRIDNAVSLDAKDRIRIGFAYRTDSNDTATSITRDYAAADCIDKGYFTVKIPLSDYPAFVSANYIPWLRLFVNFVGNGDTNASITYDYFYIGPDLAHDYLLFDFSGTGVDQERYNSDIYGGTDFDKKANWNSGSTLKSTTFSTSDNGTVKLETMDSGRHEFNLVSPDFRGLRYVPGENDVCEIRLKIDDAISLKEDSKIRIGLSYRTDLNDAAVTRYQDVALADYADKGYFKVRIPLADDANYCEANYISWMGLVFNYLESGDSNATITVDSVYVGADQKSNCLYFDFTNTADDERRYDSAPYGFVNFDVASNWQVGATLKTPVLNSSDIGTLQLEVADGYDGGGWHEINAVSPDFGQMRFAPGKNDVCEIKLKIDDAISLREDGKIRIGFSYRTDKNDQTVSRYKEIVLADYVGKGYFTVRIPLSSYADYCNANHISWIRLIFNYLGCADSNATITYDSVYIGPDRTNDSLLFDFTDNASDEERYTADAYGGLNFDKASNWQAGSSLKTPVFASSDLGTVKLEIVDGYERDGLHEINIGADASYRGLQYQPTKDDIFEVKLRIDNAICLQKNAHIKVGFSYRTNKNDTPVKIYKLVRLADYVDKGYIKVRIPLRDYAGYCNANYISWMNLFVDDLGCRDSCASITYDYAYVGPEHSVDVLPGMRATDRVNGSYLLDENGAVLASDCHGARICVDSGKFYCECSERHELTDAQLYAVGRYYITDNTGKKVTSVCHGAGISCAYIYDSATKKDVYYYVCECGSYHQMKNSQLLYSGVSCYDDQYEIDGPANELYLKDGSGVAFDVGTSKHVQISLKAVKGGSVTLWAYNGTTKQMEDTGITTSIPVEMYYDLPNQFISNGSVYLMCKSSDSSAMMSLCNLKVFDGKKPTVKAGLAVRAQRIFAQLNEPLDEALNFKVNITTGAEMTVNYNVVGEKLASYEDFYLVVEKYNADGSSVMTTYGITEDRVPMGILGDGIMYTATYTGISAKEMGDRFAATLYAIDADGRIYRGNTVENSIKDYLISKIDTAGPELNTMAVDMLKYGAAAQMNFDYNVENLVTDSLTPEQLAYATKGAPEATDHYCVTGEGANVSANITVGSKVELNLSAISRTVTDPNAVRCVITDEDGDVLAQMPVSIMADIMFSAKYDNVGAREMRKLITATFFEGDKPISKSVTWSVESYVAQMRANAKSTTEEIALVDAMLAYGDSVAAYLASNGL